MTAATRESETENEHVGFALIHGAGLGGWIWREVTPRLEHPALAVDLPGRSGSTAGGKNRTLDAYAASVEREIHERPVRRVVLVAHSIAGVVALEVAGRLGDRLVGLVAVGAAIPEGGGSFLSVLPMPQRIIMAGVLRLLGTRPPESAIRRSLCGDLAPGISDEVVRRFSPESRSLYFSRTDAAVPDVPAFYVRLTADKEFGVPLQDRMAANLRANRVTDIACGHMPMLSEPGALARILDQFARRL